MVHAQRYLYEELPDNVFIQILSMQFLQVRMQVAMLAVFHNDIDLGVVLHERVIVPDDVRGVNDPHYVDLLQSFVALLLGHAARVHFLYHVNLFACYNPQVGEYNE